MGNHGRRPLSLLLAYHPSLLAPPSLLQRRRILSPSRAGVVSPVAARVPPWRRVAPVPCRASVPRRSRRAMPSRSDASAGATTVRATPRRTAEGRGKLCPWAPPITRRPAPACFKFRSCTVLTNPEASLPFHLSVSRLACLSACLPR